MLIGGKRGRLGVHLGQKFLPKVVGYGEQRGQALTESAMAMRKLGCTRVFGRGGQKVRTLFVGGMVATGGGWRWPKLGVGLLQEGDNILGGLGRWANRWEWETQRGWPFPVKRRP